MILESIVTTKSADGVVNIAPMGPHFDLNSDFFELRPFQTSTTYSNLCVTPCGVLHTTDDVLLFAAAALHRFESFPRLVAASDVDVDRLADCCQWFEFKTKHINSSDARAIIHCEIVNRGRHRDFVGFNRAKNAVIEATILATRVDFIPLEEIENQLEPLQVIVQKTGGPLESKAFELVRRHVQAAQRCGPSSELSPK